MLKLVGLVLVLVLGVLAALWLGGAGMLGYSGFGMDSGMMSGIVAGFTPVYLMAIIGLGLLLVYWLSRSRAPVAAKVSSTSALEVSKMRYAKGEITKEQYDSIKHDLRK